MDGNNPELIYEMVANDEMRDSVELWGHWPLGPSRWAVCV
jgi:hypothetical protein